MFNLRSGVAVAAVAVAGLVATNAFAGDKAGGKDNMVKCSGVNECKGKGACKGDGNGCSGQNGCKGKGWVKMSDKDCKAKNGKVVP